MAEKKIQANCDYCTNYLYDDEDETYYCEKNLDEDEMWHFISGNLKECPYFQYADEYRVVRKQM